MLPPGDPGRKVLVIDGGTNALTQLPAPDPREHVLKVRGEVDCSGPMDALPVKLTAIGPGVSRLRTAHHGAGTKEQAFTLPLLAAKYRPAAGSFALESQSATSVAALNEDFTWRAEGTCVGLYSTRRGRRAAAGAVLAAQRVGPGAASPEGRTLPEPGVSAHCWRRSSSLRCPPKAQPAVLPGVRENGAAPLRWRVEWTKLGDGKVAARLRAELARGELTAAETPVVQRQLRELMAALAAGVVLPEAP